MLVEMSLKSTQHFSRSHLCVPGVWSYFIHANVRWRLGPPEEIISSPAFHHWHRTLEDHKDHNYASMLPVMDRVWDFLSAKGLACRLWDRDPDAEHIGRPDTGPFCAQPDPSRLGGQSSQSEGIDAVIQRAAEILLGARPVESVYAVIRLTPAVTKTKRSAMNWRETGA